MVFSILALSLVVVTGFMGQISLAQLSLSGISAFVLARLTAEAGVPFPLSLLIAALAAAVVGVLIGLPALRVRGLSLAVVTLSAAVAIDTLYFSNNFLNGGLAGGVIEGPSLFGMDLRIGGGRGYPRVAFGLVVLVCAAAAALSVANLRLSSLGRQMLAVRVNERAAAAAGVNVARTKLCAFAIGAFLAGLGGALLGYQQTRVSAETFAVLAGVTVLTVAYLGGITSVTGAMIAGLAGSGGLIFTVFDRNVHMGKYYEVITGLGLVVVAIRHPAGIAGDIHHLQEKRAERKQVQRVRAVATQPGAPPKPAVLERANL
jgi:ABC-type branched-subunit amino acid transport system permease subunit